MSKLKIKPKNLYSIFDYKNIVSLMLFKEIKPDMHYIKNHQNQIPWPDVIEAILTTKNRRRKADKIEIKTKKYYFLCKLKNKILWVINAKLKK